MLPLKKQKELLHTLLIAFAGMGFIVFVLSFLVFSIFGFIKYLLPFFISFLATNSGSMIAFSFKVIVMGFMLVFISVMYWISYAFSIQYIEHHMVEKPNFAIKAIIFSIALPLFLVLAVCAPLVDIGTALSKRKVLWRIGLVFGCLGVIASVAGFIFVLWNKIL
jgi:hypothetical protein